MNVSCCCGAELVTDYRPRYKKKLLCKECHKHCFPKQLPEVDSLNIELDNYNALMRSCYSAMKAKESAPKQKAISQQFNAARATAQFEQRQDVLPEEKDSA